MAAVTVCSDVGIQEYKICHCSHFFPYYLPWKFSIFYKFSSVQSLSHVRVFAIPWTEAHQASQSITNPWRLLKLMFMESVMQSNHLILCRPLLLPPIPPSTRVFSNESTLRMRWPKYWSFSFSIIPSKEHPELISFRMDWLDLLAIQILSQILAFPCSLPAYSLQNYKIPFVPQKAGFLSYRNISWAYPIPSGHDFSLLPK